MFHAFSFAINLIFVAGFSLTGKPDLMCLSSIACGLFAIAYEVHYFANRFVELQKEAMQRDDVRASENHRL